MKVPSIDFLKYRPFYLGLSIVILCLFGGTMFYRYKTRGSVFLYSVDYTGGTQVLLGLSKHIHSEEIMKELEKNKLHGIARDFSEKEVLVRVTEHTSDSKGLAENIKEIIEKAHPDTKVEIRQIDSVGAATSESLWRKSLLAILIGLLLMLVYTWWRFWSFAFGTGVWVSLFHDAIVILTFFMIFNYEISSNVIAAILAILGYSINDTIVVFARVRENMKKLKNVSMHDIANLSINETLRRTMLTSFATFLVVLSLLIFGGHILRTLSIALVIGIVFGTYSSIAIAVPVMLLIYREKKRTTV